MKAVVILQSLLTRAVTLGLPFGLIVPILVVETQGRLFRLKVLFIANIPLIYN